MSDVREMPRVKSWPVLGSIVPMARLGALDYLRLQWRKHGDMFRLRFGTLPAVAMAHPDAIDHVLVRRRENFVKGAAYDNIRVLVGDSMLTLEGEPWKKHRRLAQPSFHGEQLARLFGAMVGETRAAIAGWRKRYANGAVMNVHDEFLHLTLNVVGATLFGERLGDKLSEGSAEAFTDAISFLSGRSNVPIVLPLSVPTPANRRLKRSLAFVDDMVAKIITDARAREPQPTLLRMLLDARDEETGERLSDRELRDEVVTLVLAGHETTALLLSWGFSVLGRYPEVVAKMRAEVEAVVGSREPTGADMSKLEYMGRVIQEIMRVRPPVWTVARNVVEDDDVCGFRVRKGEFVLPLIFLAHEHDAFWPEPARFDPDRFLPERQQGRHRSAYAPFSIGPRVCVGNMFTIMEAKIILTMILQVMDFELRSLAPVGEKTMMTMRPAGPIDVRVHWRAGTS